jgi:hypothetical protein
MKQKHSSGHNLSMNSPQKVPSALSRRRRSRIGLLAVITTVLPIVVHAGPASAGPVSTCPINEMCLMADASKSGGNWEYAFATNDNDLRNNSYYAECWSGCGFEVNDNNIMVRNRKSTTARACVYRNTSASGGSVGYANFVNAYWVSLNPINEGTSIYFRSNATC